MEATLAQKNNLDKGYVCIRSTWDNVTWQMEWSWEATYVWWTITKRGVTSKLPLGLLVNCHVHMMDNATHFVRTNLVEREGKESPKRRWYWSCFINVNNICIVVREKRYG